MNVIQMQKDLNEAIAYIRHLEQRIQELEAQQKPKPRKKEEE